MAIGTSFPHAIDSRRGYAMMLMVVGSVVISFGGLVQRNIEFADPWQVSFYRAIGLLGAVIVIIGFNNRGRKLRTMTGIGGLGLLAGAMVSVAGISFVQALAHTSVRMRCLFSVPYHFLPRCLRDCFLARSCAVRLWLPWLAPPSVWELWWYADLVSAPGSAMRWRC